MFAEQHVLSEVLDSYYDISELRTFAFEINYPIEYYPHQTKPEIIQSMIAFMERRQRIGCFARHLLKDLASKRLVNDQHTIIFSNLLTKYPCEENGQKIALIVPEEIANKTDIKSKIAAALEINEDDVYIMAAAWGSLRLLVSVPQKSVDVRKALGLTKEFQNEISSFVLFEYLSQENQNIWKYVFVYQPYLVESNRIIPRISWSQASKVYLQEISESEPGSSSKTSSNIREEDIEQAGEIYSQPIWEGESRGSSRESSNLREDDLEPGLDIETQSDGDIFTGADIPLPISNMDRTASPPVPIPGHRLEGERYAWYFVEARPTSDFISEANTGDWLLVDLKPRLTKDLQDTEQPILIVKKEEIDGTIRVRPLDPKSMFQRIYLVTLADSSTGSFWRDEATGTVTFSSEMAEIGVSRTEILGVVVGFWRPMIAVLPNAG